MQTEGLRHGNLVGSIKFGRRREEGDTFSRLIRETLGVAVYKGNDTVAMLNISTLSEEFWDGKSDESVSPIRIELTQFKGVQVEKNGKLEDEVRTYKDTYFLGRRHRGEDYGGELWLHTILDYETSLSVFDDSIGDLKHYRSVIGDILAEVPGGSSKWHRIDDILSFIDGMNSPSK